MATDIYIALGTLGLVERGAHDVTGVPPDASLIVAEAWNTMCKEAGGEAVLIVALGLKDERDANQ